MLREPKGDRCSDSHCLNWAPLQTPAMRLRTTQTGAQVRGEEKGWLEACVWWVTALHFPQILTGINHGVLGIAVTSPTLLFLFLGLMLQMFDVKVSHVESHTGDFPNVLLGGEDKRVRHQPPLESIKCHNSRADGVKQRVCLLRRFWVLVRICWLVHL